MKSYYQSTAQKLKLELLVVFRVSLDYIFMNSQMQMYIYTLAEKSSHPT